jgi:phosphohistidine phosphatase
VRRLILFRHAQAEQQSGAGDFMRELTLSGRLDAGIMGRVLAQAGYAPDLAIVSSARRTVQTWETASAAFPGAQAEFTRDVYEGSVAELRGLTERAAERTDTLMIVGHNPAIHAYAASLAGAAAGAQALREGFPTAAAAVFDHCDAGRVRLERFLKVKDFGGG